MCQTTGDMGQSLFSPDFGSSSLKPCLGVLALMHQVACLVGMGGLEGQPIQNPVLCLEHMLLSGHMVRRKLVPGPTGQPGVVALTMGTVTSLPCPLQYPLCAQSLCPLLRPPPPGFINCPCVYCFKGKGRLHCTNPPDF